MTTMDGSWRAESTYRVGTGSQHAMKELGVKTKQVALACHDLEVTWAQKVRP